MSLGIGFDLGALATAGALSANERVAGVAMQRLSSGLRVNSARDDAAGFAIAERLTSTVNGDAQAERNANDAISLFQTADQAVASMAERLQRVRELALEAMNGTESDADRASLDQDVQGSLDELDRVAASTSFNGLHLLDGSMGKALFQIGAGAQDGLSVDLSTSMRADKLGALAIATSSDLRTFNGAGGGGGFRFAGTYTTVPLGNLDFSRPDIAFSAGSATTTGAPATDYSGANRTVIAVDGHQVTLSANYGNQGALAGAIQGQLDAAQPGGYTVSTDGVHLRVARASSTQAVSLAAVSGPGGGFTASTSTAGTPAQANTHAGFDVDGHRVSITADYSGNAAGLIADIQHQLNQAQPGQYLVSGGTSGLSIAHTDGLQQPVVDAFTDAGASEFAQSGTGRLTLAAGDFTVQVGTGAAVAITGSFASPQELAAAIQSRVAGVRAVQIDNQTGQMRIVATSTITLGGTQAQSSGALAFSSLVNAPTGSLADAKVRDTEGANDALLRVDAALDTLDDQRAQFGAELSRFDDVETSLQQQSTAADATRGRIVDADYAQESATLLRARVLVQAGTALLAQANARRKDVLSLLRH